MPELFTPRTAALAELLELLRAALADRYAVERELGRGGMATVFLAQDLKHQRPVAVKLLDPELGRAVGADRFLREIEIAAKLQHPHILPLYDSGAADGFLYYVMPYVEGETLRDRLTREKQLSLEETLKIATEVASALSYAHSRGVVHRDIKPENIMLSGGSAVVADFGIARAVSAAEGKSLTQTGTVIGTPAYMSPEQAAGSAEIDGRSDEYSLACVVYEMLVGEPPFTGLTPQAVMARHSLDKVSPPSIVRATIPDAVEDAILRALAKVPADRFATTALFAEALSVPSAATGARRRVSAAGPPARRRLPLRTIALGATPLLVAAAVWATRPLWSGGGGAKTKAGFDPRHIAVLYFDDLSQKKDLGFLADGLTESLIRELSRVSALQVISRNGVKPFKNAAVRPDSLARTLQVGTLVEGSVEQAGGRLRVSVALVNANTGAQIGDTTLDRPRGEIFALQDDIAQEVALALRKLLGQEIQVQQEKAETHDAAAWEFVQRSGQVEKGIEPLLAAGDTAGAARELTRADSLLAQAQSTDRSWATPLVERGWLAYRALNLVGTFDKAYYSKWLQQGLDYAGQALKLKPDDADALTLRGTMQYWRYVLNLAPDRTEAGKLFAGAEQDLRAAVTANPNQASAWALLSHLLMRKSETPEGKLAAMRAYEADPYLTEAAAVLWRLYSASLDLEDGVEAARWCAEGRRRFPRDSKFIECQITQMALPGQKPDIRNVWQLLEDNVKLYPPNQREWRRRRGELFVAMALARAGLADSARAVALRARADATVDPARELVYIEVLLRNILGDRDEALRLVGLYLATNPQDRASMAKDDTWWLSGLRDDPRFKALVGITS